MHLFTFFSFSLFLTSFCIIYSYLPHTLLSHLPSFPTLFIYLYLCFVFLFYFSSTTHTHTHTHTHIYMSCFFIPALPRSFAPLFIPFHLFRLLICVSSFLSFIPSLIIYFCMYLFVVSFRRCFSNKIYIASNDRVTSE
jgi:hypothetical protein